MAAFRRPVLGLIVVMGIGAWLAVAGTVAAGGPDKAPTKMTLSAESQVNFGEPVHLETRLLDETGKPLSRAPVTFYSPAAFLSGTSGFMRIGDAITDDNGVATIDYVSRRDGAIDVVVEYQGDDEHATSRASAKVTVVGGHQLYESEAGIQVPYVNKWLLVGILSAVWGTLFFVVVQVIRIALEPAEVAKNTPWRH